jgi:general secretion pathway protein G
MKTTQHAPMARPTARRGFTIMEIIVVVTLIAILATILVPTMWRNIGAAKSKIASTQARKIDNVLRVYLLDSNLTLPSDGMDLRILLEPEENGGGPNGPYFNKESELLDPWGTIFVIRVPGDINYDWDIISYGEDGKPGGEGINEDITN